MRAIDMLAKDAGFHKPGEALACNTVENGERLLGMDVVASPLMPEGFFALRTEKGAMVIGQRCSFWVPFSPFGAGQE